MARGGLKNVEEFPRRIKIFVIVLIVLFLIGTFSFMSLTGSNFNDSLLRTVETLAFMFHEDSGISERMIEIFLSLVGVFLVWWVLWSLADMLLDGSLGKYLKTKFYSFKIKRMKNHIIIAGGGRIGGEIANVLSKKKEKFLIIDNDETTVRALKKKKYVVILGDASNEEVLKDAEIENAKKIIITLPKVETNVLLTLTSKELNPKIEVYARCDQPSLVSKLKKAGAKAVVVPEIIAGDKLAEDLDLD